MGSVSLPQGILQTQESNLHLPHCGQILCHLSHQVGAAPSNILVDFPGEGPVVNEDPAFPIQGVQVQSLVRELRPHMRCRASKKKKRIILGMSPPPTLRARGARNFRTSSVGCAVHMIFTFVTLAVTVDGFTVWQGLSGAVFPEFLSSMVFAALPHLLAKAALRVFHKPREEKVE